MSFHKTESAGWWDPATPSTPIATGAQQVRELAADAAQQRSLDELSARISVCRACPRLVSWREEVAETKRRAFRDESYWGRPAPGFGDPDAELAILGLAPAAHGANRTGRVFTGDRTGDWLVAALYRAGYANQPTSTHLGDGLELNGVRVLSSVRCAPPQNKPSSEEVHTCAPWLDAELQLLAPRAILMLGGLAWQAGARALGRLGWQVPRPRPKFGHGQVMTARAALEPDQQQRASQAPDPSGEPWARELRIVGCYHPSQQNTFTGKLTESMFDSALAQCSV